MYSQLDLYTAEEIKQIGLDFGQELVKARKAEPVSFSHLLLDTSKVKIPKKWKKILVVVIGGTNLKILKYENGQVELIKQQVLDPIPDSDYIVDFLGECMTGGCADGMIINFAFPSLPYVRDDMADLELITATKGHKLADMIGKLVGEVIEDRIEERFGLAIPVMAVSDMTWLHLSLPKPSSDELVLSFIQGTGMNLGYAQGGQAVSLEIGDFNSLREIDSLTFVKENYMDGPYRPLEYLLGGKYLFRHFNFYAKQLGFNEREDTRDFLSLLENEEYRGSILAQAIVDNFNKIIFEILKSTLQVFNKKQVKLNLEGGVISSQPHFESHIRQALEDYQLDIFFNHGLEEATKNVIQNLSHS